MFAPIAKVMGVQWESLAEVFNGFGVLEKEDLREGSVIGLGHEAWWGDRGR